MNLLELDLDTDEIRAMYNALSMMVDTAKGGWWRDLLKSPLRKPTPQARNEFCNLRSKQKKRLLESAHVAEKMLEAMPREDVEAWIGGTRLIK